jgi:7-keto-8-aminopelargonate synthetase-like enzyme
MRPAAQLADAQPAAPVDPIEQRVRAFWDRFSRAKAAGHYHYNRPLEDVSAGMVIRADGRELLMFASYSYLGLLGHARIGAAAK